MSQSDICEADIQTTEGFIMIGQQLPAVIDSHIQKFKTGMFTSLPATVLSYNADEQTISAKPVMLEPYKDGDVLGFPEIDDVPIIFIGGGGGVLTFPVKVGDEVLLTFSSRSFDTWWDTSNVDQLSSVQRYNAITDAVAIGGLTSKNNSVKGSTEDVELKFNDNLIRLKSDGTVEVETTSTFKVSNQDEELVALLSEIVQAVSSITTNTIYGPQPVLNKAAIESLKTRLDTFKG